MKVYVTAFIEMVMGTGIVAKIRYKPDNYSQYKEIYSTVDKIYTLESLREVMREYKEDPERLREKIIKKVIKDIESNDINCEEIINMLNRDELDFSFIYE